MDYGIGNINMKRISHQWEIWNIKDYNIHKMDKLSKEYRNIDIGPIITPKDIVHRIKTGKYDIIYPLINE